MKITRAALVPAPVAVNATDATDPETVIAAPDAGMPPVNGGASQPIPLPAAPTGSEMSKDVAPAPVTVIDEIPITRTMSANWK